MRVRFSYLVASIALLVAFPCLLGVLSSTPSARETWIALAVSTGLAALLLGFEARRDVYAFAQYSVVALLFPLTLAIGGYFGAESTTGRVESVTGAILCVAGLGAAVTKIWRDYRA